MLDVSSQHIECLDPTQGMPGPGRAAPKVGEEYLGARSSQFSASASEKQKAQPSCFSCFNPPAPTSAFSAAGPRARTAPPPAPGAGIPIPAPCGAAELCFFPALHLAGSSACSASAKPAGLCREMRRFCRPGAAAAVLRVLQPRALALSGSAVPAPTELSHVSIPTPRCAVRVRARSGARRPQRETSGT